MSLSNARSSFSNTRLTFPKTWPSFRSFKRKSQKLNWRSDVWLELFFLKRLSHLHKYSCEIGWSFADPSLKIYIFSIGMLHWVGRREHMNTYQGGGTSQGKIIPIKRHFASLVFGIFSQLVGSYPPNKYSYEISKPKLVYI